MVRYLPSFSHDFQVLSYLINTCYRLLNYTPPAVVIRLLTTNGLIAYITSWVLYLSGASSDPRLLLPAWISITTVRLPYTILWRRDILLTSATDPHIPIPCYPEPRHNKTRNSRCPSRCVRRQFRQHVFPPTSAALDS